MAVSNSDNVPMFFILKRKFPRQIVCDSQKRPTPVTFDTNTPEMLECWCLELFFFQLKRLSHSQITGKSYWPEPQIKEQTDPTSTGQIKMSA